MLTHDTEAVAAASLHTAARMLAQVLLRAFSDNINVAAGTSDAPHPV